MALLDSKIDDIEKQVEEELNRCVLLYNEYNNTIEKTIELIQDFHSKVRRRK